MLREGGDPLNETKQWNAGGVRFEYSLRASREAAGLQFDASLLEALDREAAGEEALAEAAPALRGLHNKSLLFLGDSLDGNVWTRLCHCRREHGPRYASSVIGNATRDRQRVRCYSGAQHGAFAGIFLSDDFKTCEYTRLGLTLHYSDAAYGLHPYGLVYQRDPSYLPNCSKLSLERCYVEKWLRSSNLRAGFAAMHLSLIHI